MKEIIIGAICIIVLLFALAGVDFQLRPFKLQFTHPYMALGFLLMIIGGWLIYHEGTLNSLK